MKQSLGYANDRSVYNALNQNKITEKNIQKLFLKKESYVLNQQKEMLYLHIILD